MVLHRPVELEEISVKVSFNRQSLIQQERRCRWRSEMGNLLSRRDFGKSVSVGALSGLALSSIEPLAGGQGSSTQKQGASAKSFKRMTTTFLEMINSPGIVAAPGVYDPITARIAEQVGFRCLDLSGSALGYATCMVEPNLCLENVAQATRAITAVVNIPLAVDIGAGFGEPAHVAHTIRTIEQAGAAGVHLEDQVFPKRFHYHLQYQEHTIECEAWLDKIRAALEARRDPDFVIVARTDSFKTVSFAEGVRRCNLALEAGAQAIMPAHLANKEEIIQLPKEIHAPMNWTHNEINFGLTLRDMEAMNGPKGGYKVINFVRGPIQWSYKAVKDGLTHLKQTGNTGMDAAVWVPVLDQLKETAGLPEMIAIEKRTTEKD
jgi:methylisocitrate lyase